MDCHLPHRQGEIPVLAGQFIGLDAVDVNGRILRRRLFDIAAERGQDAADICFGKIRNRQPFDDRPRTVFGIGFQTQDEFGMVGLDVAVAVFDEARRLPGIDRQEIEKRL